MSYSADVYDEMMDADGGTSEAFTDTTTDIMQRAFSGDNGEGDDDGGVDIDDPNSEYSALEDPDAPDDGGDGDDDKQQELDFGGEEEFGGQPRNDNAPAPAPATVPEQGTADGGGEGKRSPINNVKDVAALWQRAKKFPPGRAAQTAANTAVKTAASATIVGSVAWLFDDVIGTALKFLSNDLVNIFSHMFHPFYTEGVRDKADKLVKKPPAQKILTKMDELVSKFVKSKGKK